MGIQDHRPRSLDDCANKIPKPTSQISPGQFDWNTDTRLQDLVEKNDVIW